MSKTLDHYCSSLKMVRRNYPEMFLEEGETIDRLLQDLHSWLDHYCGRQGEDEEGTFDFTGHLAIRHRAKRHHLQGINQAVRKFSGEYGERFSRLIRQEAERHIFDDMGAILFAEDYQQIGFWKNYQ
jgi:hypothetical protein